MSLPAIRGSRSPRSEHYLPRIRVRVRALREAEKSAPFTITIGCFDAARAMHDVPAL
jgi:hypothetical protein